LTTPPALLVDADADDVLERAASRVDEASPDAAVSHPTAWDRKDPTGSRADWSAQDVPDDDDSEEDTPSTAHRTMVINIAHGDPLQGGGECRIAVLENGRLEELYIERQSAESHVNSIYKGRVTNIEPSIQAVFIDFGLPKHGFLHISDVHPQYFPEGHNPRGRGPEARAPEGHGPKGHGGYAVAGEDVGKKIPRRDRPLVQHCFRRGQEVIVQVTKEGVGTKGPTLTTYLSIPGRYLVMMPGLGRVGVSRKIEDPTLRRQMRDTLSQLPLPDGMGFILRTAGLGRTKRELTRDLQYLNRLWKIITDRIKKLRTPAELYQESDLVIRTIRDVLTSDFDRIVVDDEATAHKAQEFLKIAMRPGRHAQAPGNMVEIFRGPEPIFHKFGIEQEIERINSRHVPLPSGGSIVIDSTEAMVAIDVNSGRYRAVDDPEESAFRIDLEAAEEIARQLRLRDLGGRKGQFRNLEHGFFRDG